VNHYEGGGKHKRSKALEAALAQYRGAEREAQARALLAYADEARPEFGGMLRAFAWELRLDALREADAEREVVAALKAPDDPSEIPPLEPTKGTGTLLVDFDTGENLPSFEVGGE
jgi:hypothetical protein